MSVQARFSADFSSFQSAVNGAESKLVDFAAGAHKVEKSLARMTDAFSGRKLIQEAAVMTRSIEDVGGISKLTGAELASAGAKASVAAEKMTRMGMEVPPGLQHIADAAKHIEPPLTLGQKAAGLLTSAFGQFTVAGLATSAIQKLGAGVMEFVDTGAKLPAIEGAFQRLTAGLKQNSREMIGNMSAATQGLVSDFNLMETANKAMLLGLPVTSASMGELAKTATVLGKAMGQDATKSLDDLITALGRSSPMILDNLGLSVKVGEANEQYAAKLNKTAEQLTDAEKKMAFYDAAMEAARKKTAELGEQTKTLGEIATTVWTKVGNVITSTAADINVGMGAVFTDSRQLVTFLDNAMKLGPGAAISMAAMAAQLKDVKSSAKDIDLDAPQTSLEKFGKYLAGLGAHFDPLTESQRKYATEAIRLGVPLAKIAEGLEVNEKLISNLDEANKKGTESSRKYAEAWQKLNELSTVSADATGMVSEEIRNQIIYYTKLGASVDDIVSARITEKGVVEAVARSYEAGEKALTDTIARITEFRDVGVEGAAAVAKGFAGMPLVLSTMAQTMGTLGLSSRQTVSIGALIGTTFSEAGKKSADAMTSAARAFIPLTTEQRAAIQRMHELGYTTAEIAATMNVSIQQVQQTTKKWVDGLKTDLGSLASAFGTLAQVSGGSFGGIVKDLGEMFAALNLTQKGMEQFNKEGATVGDKIAGMTTAVAGFISATGKGGVKGVLGGALSGAEIGGQFGGAWGAAVGAAVGAAAGLIRNLFGKSPARILDDKATEDIKKLQAELLKTYGSLDKIDAIGKQMGIDLAGAWGDQSQAGLVHFTGLMKEFEGKEQDVHSALGVFTAAVQTAGGTLPEYLRPFGETLLGLKGLTDNETAAIKAMLGSAEPDFKALEQTAAGYGIKLADLGPKFQSAHIDALAKTYGKDFKDLIDAGADMNGVLAGMADEISGLVNDSKKFGVDIPDNMKPTIQKLIDMGLLTDDNGKKITDITGINFKETPLDKGAKAIVDAIDRLGVLLSGLPGIAATAAAGVGGALNSVHIAPIDVHYRFVADNGMDADVSRAAAGGMVTRAGVQYLAGGGNVLPFMPRGSDTVPAMLTPGEAVLNRGAVATLGPDAIRALNRGQRGGGGGGAPVVDIRPHLERIEQRLAAQELAAARRAAELPRALARASVEAAQTVQRRR